MTSRKTFTIKIEGGSTLEIHLKGNVPLFHDGRRTIWSIFVKPSEARILCDQIKRSGCEVELVSPQEKDCQPDYIRHCNLCALKDRYPSGCCMDENS
jgi:hypothetical protein